MKRLELENLAVSFRIDDPNLRHFTVHNAMTSLGGEIAFLYGMFAAEPKRNTKRRRAMRLLLAEKLSSKAMEAP